jgi:hypothetical protein
LVDATHGADPVTTRYPKNRRILLKPNELIRELMTPALAPPVLFALILFYALFELASLGRIFGLVLALVLATPIVVFVLPALLRYLMVVLQARAYGREPEPLDINLVSWVGNVWTLFPIVHVAAIIYAVYITANYFGGTSALIVAVAYATLLPASLIVLAISHSALSSLNPFTIFELVKRCGFSYLIGPAFVIAATWVVIRINVTFDMNMLTEFVSLYFVFAAFAIFGSIVRPLHLERELDIPMPASVDEDVRQDRHLLERTMVLNHAYGIVSRGNRAQGLEHIYKTLADDPNDAAGWAWFFENMLRWENPEAAFAFAQQYVHELLSYGENVKAVKVMMRCRLVNPAFKPLIEDLELAAAAAEECHNEELANFLR